MTTQERIQQQLGALLLANIQLAAENEDLKAMVAELTKKAATQPAPIAS